MIDVSNLVRKTKGTKVFYTDTESMDIIAKSCSKCETNYSLERFRLDKKGVGGRRSVCRECDNQSNRDYLIENRDKEVLRKRKWREENKEEVNEKFRIWRKENKLKNNLYAERRRARKRSLPDTFTEEQSENVLKYFNNSCALTGETVGWQWDHVIPLSTGCVGTVLENMIPLKDTLNFSKSDKNIFEWFRESKNVLCLDSDKFENLIKYLADINKMSVSEYHSFVYKCHKN